MGRLVILALQFEPSPESVLEYHHDSSAWRTDRANEWIPSASGPDQDFLYKWFSDLDGSSSTSWFSRQLNSMALLQPDRSTMPAYMLHEHASTQNIVDRRSPPIRLSRSMPRIRSHDSVALPDTSRPTSVEQSYDQIIHPTSGEGLFLMCKREAHTEHRGDPFGESLEALPQCDSWDIQTDSATSSRSSKQEMLRPRPDVQTGGLSGGIKESKHGRLSGLRKTRSRMFGRG